ncbi:hypothetical protein J2W34_002328 [Variovorax boronicumulans]|uniref:hypothetical protein n=1 Tax=Variovorax boronicumulans TaxID=436515 RepID=UPI0027838058|nr:hypothetical protein [Variovorax boronicumulans]MDQ0070543.1 hypothetical protein [Variovorax boronicumulans]
MTITSGVRKALIGGLCLLTGVAAFSQWPSSGALDSSYKPGRSALPVATYRGMSTSEFRSMVRKAFQESGFTFVSANSQKDKPTVIRFELIINPKTEINPTILVSIDESLLDSRRNCNPCFLRFTEISNEQEMKALPWMMQYKLTSLLLPAIDKAYSNIELSGRTHLAPSFSFNYKPQWKGEKNLFGNSYTGIGLPDLKERLINAYRSAGFTPIENDVNLKSSELDLIFSFPIDPAKDGGAVYKLKINSQFDANGHCYPCEITENYDPYQRLPPAGLSGVFDRATLESRFSAARSTAFENMRIDLESYLRPRSGFTVPAKLAPLGSPRPPPTPIAVT